MFLPVRYLEGQGGELIQYWRLAGLALVGIAAQGTAVLGSNPYKLEALLEWVPWGVVMQSRNCCARPREVIESGRYFQGSPRLSPTLLANVALLGEM